MAIDIEAPGGDEAALKAALRDLVGIQFARVSVSSAEILDLFDTPKQLIAAPGAEKIIAVDQLTVFQVFVTTPYTYVGEQFFSHLTSDIGIYGGLGFAASGIWRLNEYAAAFGTSIERANVENKPLYLLDDTQNPEAGDGTLIIEILYRIVDLP